MADFGTLFTLFLVALAFVTVGVCFLVYIMIIGEREKRRKAQGIPVSEDETDPACPHRLGYLSGFPLNQPIPEECFGCVNAIQCMNQREQTTEAETEAAESTEPE